MNVRRLDSRTLFQAAALLAVPVIIVLGMGLLAGGYALQRERQIADQRLEQAFHQFVCIAARNTLTSGQRSDSEKEMIIGFYNNILVELGADPCSPEELLKKPG